MEMRLKLPIITLREFHTPIIPAMAMPPMPMLLAYWKRAWGLASAASVPPASCISGKRKAIAGTTIHHISTEPAHMMEAYFSPTIYPMPSRAAEVLMLKNSFAFSATKTPTAEKAEVKFSAHAPKVATRKS